MQSLILLCLVLGGIYMFAISDWFFRLALVIGVILGLGYSAAEAQVIGLHTWSEHSRDTHAMTHEGGPNTYKKFNEENWGLYYIDQSGFTVGGYRNSYYKNTFYVGWSLETDPWYGLRAAITGAFATGYDTVHGVGAIRPMLMPSVVLDVGSPARLRWSVAPAKGGVFQHLSLEWSFK